MSGATSRKNTGVGILIGMPFLLVFVVIAVIELTIFSWAWSAIGAGWTIGLTLLTGIVGAYLVRHQGFSVYRQARQRVESGGFPGRELAHGAMVLVGAAFLLTPGFLTDIVGFTLMWYPAREVIRRFGEKRLKRRGAVLFEGPLGSTLFSEEREGEAPFSEGPIVEGPIIEGNVVDEPFLDGQAIDERFLD